MIFSFLTKINEMITMTSYRDSLAQNKYAHRSPFKMATFRFFHLEHNYSSIMFIPTKSVVGFLMCLVALLSWATMNNAVLCSLSPAGVYHLNFMLWRFIWMLVLCCILGGSFMPPNTDSVWKNIKYVLSAPKQIIMIRFGATFAGGFTDMLFCIFIMMSVKGSGLSNSCPLQIGLATVFGSILTFEWRCNITVRYCLERKGNLWFLIPGLLMNILGITLNSVTYSYGKALISIVASLQRINGVSSRIPFFWRKTDQNKRKSVCGS